MAIHKLDSSEFDEIDYQLIAIHTSLDDYRLVYFINQMLPVLLIKSTNDLPIILNEGVTSFSRFIFEDPRKEIFWNLIENESEVIRDKNDNSPNLFTNSNLAFVTKVYLLPEFKKVDYFLKIENAEQSIEEITTTIQTIDRISTAYPVKMDQIKSKNNLIF